MPFMKKRESGSSRLDIAFILYNPSDLHFPHEVASGEDTETNQRQYTLII
jgi:hypothetical protein